MRSQRVGCGQIVDRTWWRLGALLPLIWALAGPAANAQLIEPKPDPYFRPNPTTELKPATSPPNRSVSTGILATADADATSPSNLPGRSFEPGQVIAIVAGEPIFYSDMALEVSQILEKALPGAPPEVRQRETGRVIQVLIPRYVEQKLLLVYAKQQLPEGASWPKIVEQAEKEFDDKVLPKLMERLGATNRLEVDGQLRAQGSSLRLFKLRWAEDQIARYFTMQKINVDPEITHQEMLDYYQNHVEEFQVKGRARWEELAVHFDRFPAREAAFEAIVKMGNEVVYGASLPAVAEKSSHGITASRGGQHDWTTRGSLVHQVIEDALFSLPLNQLSDLLETRNGVHIIRVLEREEARTIPFVEAQSSIKEKLQEEKRQAEFDRHVARLREIYPVEISEF